MGQIEVNALSVKLAGSFEAEVTFPGIHLDPERKYPVLWVIHEDGSSPADLLRYLPLFEEYAKTNNCYVICPSVQHSLCTDMVWGTLNEQFVATECPGIFRHMYHLSDRPEDNTILGIGTGAYGALKMAVRHPETYGKGIAVDGSLDLAARCDLIGKEVTSGFTRQTDASLAAIFGDPSKVRGSEHDLYALDYEGKVITLFAGSDSTVSAENVELAAKHPEISTRIEDYGKDGFERERMLKAALGI